MEKLCLNDSENDVLKQFNYKIRLKMIGIMFNRTKCKLTKEKRVLCGCDYSFMFLKQGVNNYSLIWDTQLKDTGCYQHHFHYFS